MSAFTRETYEMVHEYIASWGRKLPSKYVKIISIVSAAFGFWAFRNMFWKILNRLRSYPSGPLGLPVFGCLFPFARRPFKFSVELGQNYGSVAYVPLMVSNNLFINDPVVVKHLYQTKKILSRPNVTLRDPVPYICINGDEWVKRRKFFSQTAITLSNSAFVLNNVRQTMEYVIPRMDQRVQQKEPWIPNHDVLYFAINNSFTAVFDRVLSFDDPFVSHYGEHMEYAVKQAQLAIMLDLLTNFSGSTFLPKRLTWECHEEADRMLDEWMNQNGFEVDRERKIMRRVEAKNSGTGTKVYADFLIEKLERGEIEYEQVFAEFEQAFVGAIDTTSQASAYGFLLLAKHPSVQQRVYDELVTVMERKGLKDFDYNILNELHVFRAFIHEMLRIGSFVPQGVPHMTTEDVTFEVEGKMVAIPKNTLLHTNTLYIHRWLDWSDGNKPLKKENTDIHLEYWLDAESGKFKMNDNFVLFSVGKRDCVGKSLAMKSIYAMFALYLLKYKLVAPNNDPEGVIIEQGWSFVLQTKPIGINVEHRQ